MLNCLSELVNVITEIDHSEIKHVIVYSLVPDPHGRLVSVYTLENNVYAVRVGEILQINVEHFSDGAKVLQDFGKEYSTDGMFFYDVDSSLLTNVISGQTQSIEY